MRKKKTSLRFTGKKHARGGVISTVIGGIAWCVFIALCVCSSTTKGNAEIVVGGIGIADALFALTGTVLGVRGFQEREVHYALATVGVVLNGILFTIYFILYFMGIAIV